MNVSSKKIASILCATSLLLFMAAGCSGISGASSPSAASGFSASEVNRGAVRGLDFDNTKWNYNADDDVYWQVGVVYCATPASTTYESLGIFVPAAYMTASENSDGTYTCEVKTDGTVGGYTAKTAPVVMPINTPGYAAQNAPTNYVSGLGDYLDAGFIYVQAGCRGRESAMGGAPGGNMPTGGPPDGGPPDGNLPSGSLPAGDAASFDETVSSASAPASDETVTGSAPWGVTDLKAAVRYLRYNAGVLPGDTENIFTFGMSGGGAQSALMGTTGDSPLYDPYLASIGAATKDANGGGLSDAVAGAMCWCPITSLDYADEAYEWNMGQYVTSGTRADGLFTKELSNDLSAAFAAYINELGLVSPDGAPLALETSDTGIYAAGSYYDYLLSVIENSLNDFLADTTFPYTPDNSTQAGFAGNAGGDNGASASRTDAPTYNTAEDYIAALNISETWIEYNADTNTATVSSMSAFVNMCKGATKDVTAFDALDRSAAENTVFGSDENDSLHFDPVLADLLATGADTYAAYADWDSDYPDAYAEDLAYVNAEGDGIATRVDMYNPMYYLCEYYDGYGTSTVAPHFRIRTGLFQGDTALTVETNLALALAANDVDVDFATVWGQYHTTAERTGDATANFITWVQACTA